MIRDDVYSEVYCAAAVGDFLSIAEDLRRPGMTLEAKVSRILEFKKTMAGIEEHLESVFDPEAIAAAMRLVSAAGINAADAFNALKGVIYDASSV